MPGIYIVVNIQKNKHHIIIIQYITTITIHGDDRYCLMMVDTDLFDNYYFGLKVGKYLIVPSHGQK